MSKHSHSESSGRRFARNFLAFALFLDISLLSLVCCVRLYFIAPQNIVNVFTDEEYVSDLTDDVLEYSHDLLADSGVPENTLDDTLTEKELYEIENAYMSGALGTSEKYTSTTYRDNLKELSGKIETAVNQAVTGNNLSVDPDEKDGASEIASLIISHISSRLSLAHADKIEEVLNVGKTACLIAIIALAVIAVVLILIVVSIGEKRYRALRNVVWSFSAAGVLNLILICGVEIVKRYKTLVLYPVYLADSVMRYVSRCEAAVGYSSLILFAAAFVLTAVVWKMNRDSKK